MKPFAHAGEIVERLRRSTVLVASGRHGSGSGVIVDSAGTIVTNAHVVGKRDVRVQTWDGETHRAAVDSIDTNNDLAKITISAPELQPAELGNSRDLKTGELVVAVGNPLGFVGAATMGVVHAVGPISGMGASEWIQSDVRLAPGNSGGPLANSAGTVIGINSMVMNGIGVAIPSNAVKRFLESGGRKETLGVAVKPVHLSIAGESGIGFYIVDIAGGSPAENASLHKGDLMIGAGDTLFHSSEDLYEAIGGNGERAVRIRFLRGNSRQTRLATVLLGPPGNRAA